MNKLPPEINIVLLLKLFFLQLATAGGTRVVVLLELGVKARKGVNHRGLRGSQETFFCDPNDNGY